MRQTACLLVLLLAACAAQEPIPTSAPGAEAAAPSQPRRAAPPARTTSTNIDEYKREVAQRIVSASPHVYDDPVEPMLKSIVVLDITIDRRGQLTAVKVRRSNGYRDLENRALESVRRAAPFAAPPRNRPVNYLETFLFRDDGRFRVRSLVEG